MSFSFNHTWRTLLSSILLNGVEVSPRGQRTKELAQKTIEVDMRRPVLTDPDRKLSYQGMAAEAHWIVTGDSSLAGIEPWLPKMRDFSDDGLTLAGAYGPRIAEQMAYVVTKLMDDKDTRQATMTLWNRNPGPSKDYPCTVAMDFKRRPDPEYQDLEVLNMHVFMRSSDAWLGIPYDVFSFSMVAHQVCALVNTNLSLQGKAYEPITPGTLYLTAASSHLYERNWLEALACLAPFTDLPDESQYLTPSFMYTQPDRLMSRLQMLRTTKPGDRLRWWETGQ
jgi:thymidylate synthase